MKTITTMNDVLAVPRALGNGLVLRQATAADANALSDFDAHIFADRETGEPAEWARLWTQDMIGGTHPCIGPDDLLLVEDTRTGRIASAIHLISQTWAYAGIPFGVGRPELVGTHPDYRRRGLVRALFDTFHACSAARGELMQVITGIPWYYRQFGYELAVPHEGGRTVALSEIAPLRAGETEPFTLRNATEADLPLLQQAEETLTTAHLFACVRDDALWRYALSGYTRFRAAPGVSRDRIVGRHPVGYVAHPPRLSRRLFRDGTFYVTHFALLAGVSWAAVIPSVLRALRQLRKPIREMVGRQRCASRSNSARSTPRSWSHPIDSRPHLAGCVVCPRAGFARLSVARHASARTPPRRRAPSRGTPANWR